MLGWQPLMESWVNTLPSTLSDERKDLIRSLYTRMVPCCLNFLRKGGFKVRSFGNLVVIGGQDNGFESWRLMYVCVCVQLLSKMC